MTFTRIPVDERTLIWRRDRRAEADDGEDLEPRCTGDRHCDCDSCESRREDEGR